MKELINLKKLAKKIPGVVHTDQTGRIQTVSKNKFKFYKLIENFKHITGPYFVKYFL